MPNRSGVLDRQLTALERHEATAVRRVAAAYRKARQEIVDRLIMRWPGQVMTPNQAVAMARQLGLVEQIDARLRQLEGELGMILRDTVTSSSEFAIEQMRQELALLPPTIRQPIADRALSFGAINHQMIERFLPVAVNDAQLATRALSLQLGRELQTGLIQGQSFDSLVRRMMASTPTGAGPAVWARGENSAMLMVRRTVITSENAAKVATLAEVNRAIPEVRKQAIATIGRTTTDCCIRVHGQIQPVSEPFQLTGEPRFADEMMMPSFHWNCRTSVAMHHPVFEQSGLSTADMRSSAQAELRRRENEPAGRRERVA